jgi:hypothetical protein
MTTQVARGSVDFSVYFDAEDWLEGNIWAADGVFSGYVTLRLRGNLVLDWWPCGMNNSAISLVRSAISDHVAATAPTSLQAKWPLFSCPARLANGCGVIGDFSTTRRGNVVMLSAFHGCDIDADRSISVPWRSWARAVESFGRLTLRHLPLVKKGMRVRVWPQYLRYRSLLQRDLLQLRSLMSANES